MDATQARRRQAELDAVAASEGRNPEKVAPDLSFADFGVEIGEGGTPFRMCYEWAGDHYEGFASLRRVRAGGRDRRGR